MVKRSYEFVDIALLKQREKELLEREEKETTRIFKVCSRCGVRKPLLEFSTDKRNSTSKTNTCKKCKIIEYLKYYYQNQAKILIVNKKYRDDHKGIRTKYFQKYQEDHKKHLQQIAKVWYQANKERIKKRNLERKLILKEM